MESKNIDKEIMIRKSKQYSLNIKNKAKLLNSTTFFMESKNIDKELRKVMIRRSRRMSRIRRFLKYINTKRIYGK